MVLLDSLSPLFRILRCLFLLCNSACILMGAGGGGGGGSLWRPAQLPRHSSDPAVRALTPREQWKFWRAPQLVCSVNCSSQSCYRQTKYVMLMVNCRLLPLSLSSVIVWTVFGEVHSLSPTTHVVLISAFVLFG